MNAPCAVQPSRTGTPLGFLDIDSLRVQLGRPITPNPSWISRRGRSRTAIPRQKSRARTRLRRSWVPTLTFHRPGDAGRCRPAARLIKKSSRANGRAGADLSFQRDDCAEIWRLVRPRWRRPFPRMPCCSRSAKSRRPISRHFRAGRTSRKGHLPTHALQQTTPCRGGGAADVTLGRLEQLRPAPVELGFAR